MKKRVLLLFIGIISFLSVWSQNDSLQFKSIFVGVRNNKYASIGFQAKNWSVGLENTIFIRHLNEQYIRANGTFRYSTGVWGVKFSAEAFFGTNYAGRFYDSGLKIGLDKKIGRVEFGAGVMPMYDSGMGYNTCCLSCDPRGSIGFRYNEYSGVSYGRTSYCSGHSFSSS